MKILHLADPDHARASQLIRLSQESGHEAWLSPQTSPLALAAYIRQARPQILHVHERNEIPRLMWPLLSQSKVGVVRTIAELPPEESERQRLYKRKRYAREVLSTPSRQIQYQLLVEGGLRAAYIPDGYSPADTTSVSIKKVGGLSRRQYCVALTDSLSELMWMVQAHAQAGTARKLVYPAYRYSKKLHHLQQVFDSFRVVIISQPIERTALIRNAAVVVFGTVLPNRGDLLFQAMDAARPIIAVNTGHTSETLGTGGLYVKAHDAAFLSKGIVALLREEARDNLHGSKAQTRAQHHFQWPHLFKDYLHLYRLAADGPAIQVPVDSVIGDATAPVLMAQQEHI